MTCPTLSMFLLLQDGDESLRTIRCGHFLLFFFNDRATTEIYTSPYTLSLHDALPISSPRCAHTRGRCDTPGRSPSRPRSEEHTSELQSHGLISYAVFCLKKKKQP